MSLHFVDTGQRRVFGDSLLYLPFSSKFQESDKILYNTINKANNILIEDGFLYTTPFIEKDDNISVVFGEIYKKNISIKLEDFINISSKNISIEEKVIKVLNNIFFENSLEWDIYQDKYYYIKVHGEVIFPRYFKSLYKIVHNLFLEIKNKEIVLDSDDYKNLKDAFYIVDHLHESDNRLINSIGKFLLIFPDISKDFINKIKMGKIEEDIITSGFLSLFSRNRPRSKDITIYNKPRIDGIIHINHPFFFPYNPLKWLPEDDQETDYYYLIVAIGCYENIDIQVVINPKDIFSIEYLFFNNGYYPSFYPGIFFINKLFNTKDNFREKYTEIEKLSPIYDKIKEFVLDFDVEYLIKRIHEIRTESNLENIYYFDLSLKDNYIEISTDPYYGNIKYYKLGESVNNKMYNKDEEDTIISDNCNLLEDKKFIKNITNKGKVI